MARGAAGAGTPAEVRLRRRSGLSASRFYGVWQAACDQVIREDPSAARKRCRLCLTLAPL